MLRKISFFIDYLLLGAGWVLLSLMRATVWFNHLLYRTEEHIYRIHQALRSTEEVVAVSKRRP